MQTNSSSVVHSDGSSLHWRWIATASFIVILDGCSTATTYTAIPVILSPQRNVFTHSTIVKTFSGFTFKFTILKNSSLSSLCVLWLPTHAHLSADADQPFQTNKHTLDWVTRCAVAWNGNYKRQIKYDTCPLCYIWKESVVLMSRVLLA